jgi:hypothetical protein
MDEYETRYIGGYAVKVRKESSGKKIKKDQPLGGRKHTIKDNLVIGDQEIQTMLMHFHPEPIDYEDFQIVTQSGDELSQTFKILTIEYPSKKQKNFIVAKGDSGLIDGINGNFPIYCYFIPSGIDEKLDETIKSFLKTWGESYKDNIFVGFFDVGSKSLQKLIMDIKIIPPTILLLDTPWYEENTFHFQLSGFSNLQNEQLKAVLSYLYGKMLDKETKKNIKSTIQLKTFVFSFKSTAYILNLLKSIKISIGLGGLTLKSP